MRVTIKFGQQLKIVYIPYRALKKCQAVHIHHDKEALVQKVDPSVFLWLITICETEEMKIDITLFNFWATIVVAFKLDISKILQECLSFWQSNFTELIKQEEYIDARVYPSALL